MPLVISVAGSTRTTSCDFQSLHITQSVVSNAGGAETVIHVPDRSWHPAAANEYIVMTSSDSVKHFAGMITEVQEEMAGLTQLRYRLTAKDYTYLFDRLMVTEIYASSGPTANLNIDTVVADITTRFTTGFSTGGIQSGLGTLAQHRFDYVYPSDACRGMADELAVLFYIDYDKVVNLRTPGSDVAPIPEIDLDTFSSSANWSNCVLSEAAANIKNRIILQGYKTKSTVAYQNVFTGDGVSKFFPLGYEPSGIATTELVATLNAVTLTNKTDNIDGSPSTTAGSTAQVFICYTNMGARTDFSPSSTETLTLTYNYMLDGGTQVDDAAAQTEMASREGGDGIHMYQVNDPGLTNYQSNDNLAIARGQTLTARYGRPVLQAEFDSLEQGWKPGQAFAMSSVYRMGGFDKTFYVYEMEKSLVNHPGTTGTPMWRYHILAGATPLPL